MAGNNNVGALVKQLNEQRHPAAADFDRGVSGKIFVWREPMCYALNIVNNSPGSLWVNWTGSTPELREADRTADIIGNSLKTLPKRRTSVAIPFTVSAAENKNRNCPPGEVFDADGRKMRHSVVIFACPRAKRLYYYDPMGCSSYEAIIIVDVAKRMGETWEAYCGYSREGPVASLQQWLDLLPVCNLCSAYAILVLSKSADLFASLRDMHNRTTSSFLLNDRNLEHLFEVVRFWKRCDK